MKKFHRFLALLLTLVTVVAMLPLSVIAETWADLNVKTDDTADGKPTTVTLNLNADVLADILQKDGISPSLLQDLKAGVEVDINELMSAFSLEELFEIVPREELINVLGGVEGLLNKIGFDALMDMIEDPNALIDDLIQNPEAFLNAFDMNALIRAIGRVNDPSLDDAAAMTAGINALATYLKPEAQTLIDKLGGLSGLGLDLEALIEAAGGVEAIVLQLDKKALVEDLGFADILSVLDVPAFIDSLGGLKNLVEKDMLNLGALIEDIEFSELMNALNITTENISGLIADVQKLLELLESNPNLISYVKVEDLLADGYVKEEDIVDVLLNDDVFMSQIAAGVGVNKEEAKKILATKAESDPDALYSLLNVAKLVADPAMLHTVMPALDFAAFEALVANETIKFTPDPNGAPDQRRTVADLIQAIQTLTGTDLTYLVQGLLMSVYDVKDALDELDLVVARDGQYLGIEEYLLANKWIDIQEVLDGGVHVDELVIAAELAEVVKTIPADTFYGYINDIEDFVHVISFHEALIVLGGIDGIKNVIDLDALKNKIDAPAILDSLGANAINYVDVNALFVDGVVSVNQLLSLGIVKEQKLLESLNTQTIDNLAQLGVYDKAEEQVEQWTNRQIESLENLGQAVTDQIDALSTLPNFYNVIVDHVLATGNQSLINNLYNEVVEQLLGRDPSQNMAVYRAAVEILLANSTAVSELHLYQVALEQLSFEKMQELGLIEKAMEQIDTDEITEIIRLVGIRDYAQDILNLVYRKVLGNVNEVSIDSTVVAKEDADGFLQIDADALVKALVQLIPTLSEIENLDNNNDPLISTVIKLGYSVDKAVDENQPEKTKLINVVVNLKGDIERLKAVAGKLSAILDKLSSLDGTFSVDYTVPQTVTKLYAKVLDYDALDDALKVKLLNLANVNGDETMAFTEALSFEDIVAILDAIEPSKMYNVIRNYEYVQLVVKKIAEKTGYDLNNVSLDELVDAAATLPSFERIAELLEQKTGRDIMAYVDTLAVKFDAAADRVEQIAVVQRALNAVESRFGFDLSDISVEEIVDRAKDAPIAETIANVISAKIGRDVQAYLDILAGDEVTVDEIYDALVQKVAEQEYRYNVIINSIQAKAEYLPDRLMKLRLSDFYRGNGVFAGDKSVTLNAKELVEKAARKLLNRLNLGDKLDLDAAIDLIMSTVNGGESLTLGLDLTLRFQDLYQINYYDHSGEKLLFSAFLPVGADLTVYKNNPGITGYDFQSWGNDQNEMITVMPAADTDVYADYAYVEVSFMANGKQYGMMMMDKVTAFGQYDLSDINEKVKPFLSTSSSGVIAEYKVGWSVDGTLAGLVSKYDVITEDTVLYMVSVPVYHLVFDNEDIGYHVVKLDDGTYKLTITDEFVPSNYRLKLDRGLLTDANADSRVKLEIVHGDKEQYRIVIPNRVLKQFYRWNSTVEFSYSDPEQIPESFHGTYYADETGTVAAPTAEFYSFDVLKDGEAWTGEGKSFDEPIQIRLPYENVPTPGNGVTLNTYTMVNGKRESVTVSDSDFENKTVTFEASHFSDFVLVNERLMSLTFKTERGNQVFGTLEGETKSDAYFPLNAEIALNFNLPVGYKVVKISDAADAEYEHKSIFTMPDANVQLTIVLGERDYYIYYYNGDTLLKTQPFAATATSVELYKFADIVEEFDLTPDAGFAKTGKWATIPATEPVDGVQTLVFSNDLNDKHDYKVFVQWDLMTYTVKFQDKIGSDATVLDEISGLTVNDFASLVPPALDSLKVPGKTVSWAEIKVENAVDGVIIVLPVYSDYLSYQIHKDSDVIINNDPNAPTEFQYGTQIGVSATEKTGYDAVIKVLNANGEEVALTNGQLTMPDSDVYITVTYTPKKMSYTFGGVAIDGYYGELRTFTITVRGNQIVTNLSVDCDLIGVSVAADGTKTLTYSFVLTEDGTVITYEVKHASLAAAILKIFNGNIFDGDGNPVSALKNVEFAGWSDAVAGLQFATFFLQETAASLLWLWILLGVLLLIAIIVLIYLLHVTGKIGVNFLTRFVCWIVGGFIAICLAISGFVLKLFGLAGESDQPEDYGFEPEAVPEEETAEEEVAEEKSAEEIDLINSINLAMANKEATEEETVEETAEEVTEEEAVEETAEEATEEEAVEETAEEATEEEATEEEATEEEAVEETAEEATEEEAVEETAEEATEEDSDEEKKENK